MAARSCLVNAPVRPEQKPEPSATLHALVSTRSSGVGQLATTQLTELVVLVCVLEFIGLFVASHKAGSYLHRPAVVVRRFFSSPKMEGCTRRPKGSIRETGCLSQQEEDLPVGFRMTLSFPNAKISQRTIYSSLAYANDRRMNITPEYLLIQRTLVLRCGSVFQTISPGSAKPG